MEACRPSALLWDEDGASDAAVVGPAGGWGSVQRRDRRPPLAAWPHLPRRWARGHMSRPRLRGWALSASAPEPLGGARLLIDTWRTAGAATQVVAAAPPPLVDDPSVLGDGPSAAFVACRCRSGSAPLLRAGPGSRVGLRGTERPSAARPTPMRDPSRGAGRPQRWRTRRLRGPVRGVETATAGSPWAAGAAAPLGADARTHENAKDYPAPARGLRGGARDRAGLRLRPPGGPRGIARGSGCGGGHAPGNHPSWGGGRGLRATRWPLRRGLVATPHRRRPPAAALATGEP